MRVPFEPPSAHQLGGSFPIYQGTPYQRGAGLGSLFKSLWRFALPLAKSVGKSVGKQALRSASAIASDVAEGRDLKDAFEDHATEGARRLVRKGAKQIRRKVQRGGGLGKPTLKGTKVAKAINRGRIQKGRRKKKKTTRKSKLDALGFY